MKIKLLLGIIAAALVVIGGMYLFSVFKNSSTRLTVNTDRTAVIKEIKELQRLETASYSIEKIIEAGTEGNAFQEILYGDRILLIAHGKVIAGFDLSQLNDSDILIEDTDIQITLPPPQILIATLDNEKTKVYDRQLGLLSKGDKDLEAVARQQAELSIRQAACESKILDEASVNAKKQLTLLLASLNFSRVEIIVPSYTCQ